MTDEPGPQYVPPEERIAVFDNDGTLWCAKPMYIQLDYLLRKLVTQANVIRPSVINNPGKQHGKKTSLGWVIQLPGTTRGMMISSRSYLGDSLAF